MTGSLLLDTHIAVWAAVSDPRLKKPIRRRMLDPASTLWVSAVSLQEIAIKFAQPNRGDPLPFSATEAVRIFTEMGCRLLDLRPSHAAAFEELPPLHADPFDRLLLAQARCEGLGLLTADTKLLAYGEGVIPA